MPNGWNQTESEKRRNCSQDREKQVFSVFNEKQLMGHVVLSFLTFGQPLVHQLAFLDFGHHAEWKALVVRNIIDACCEIDDKDENSASVCTEDPLKI
jgi:hypothetical protein